MPYYYAQTSIASQTGETADYASNVFAVEADSFLNSTHVAGWLAAINDFYVDCVGIGAWKGYTSTGSTVKFYSCNQAPPVYPLFEDVLTGFVTPGAVDLPLEVALCVSYANDSVTTVSRARRRGRIYVGGWNEANNGAGRPFGSMPAELAQAYQTYAEAVNAVSELTAGIWSRAEATVYPVERCWVDNEWDTMRSRGGKSTTRATLVIV